MVSNTLVIAQSNYLEGNIVTAENDTLFGMIDFQDWSKTPESIRFKPANENSAIVYLPGELKSFEVSGERYFSRKVIIDTSPFRARSNKEVRRCV